MRILLVNNLFPPGFIGGYELGALEIARHLRRRGHEIRVLTSSHFRDDAGSFTEFPVIRKLQCVTLQRDELPEGAANDLGPFLHGGNLRILHATLREWEPDVVMLFNLEGLGALGIAALAAGDGGTPILYLMDNVFRGLRENRHRWTRYVRTCGQPDFLAGTIPVAMSLNLASEIGETLGVPLPDPVIVPGWHGPVRDRTEVFEAPRTDGRCRFVFASQLADHKGVPILLEAAALAIERGAEPFLVDLYGPGDVDRVTARANSMGLDDVVRYRGVLDKEDLCRRFADYEALLLPTWEREPFGFVVPEAAANGCFPIITAQIGAADWFLDDVDCFKVRRDPLSFAGAILAFLALSRTDRAMHRTRAKRTAMTHLGFDRWRGAIDVVVSDAATRGRPWTAARADGAYAAMLFLEEMWRAGADADRR
ncbi:glycosyltransferase family 4 protein [bacterium]|nr:glycosyltransferase family 4 protein [bacterium]